MKPGVVFDHVSKKFRRGERHDSLRDLIPALLTSPFRSSNKTVLGTGEFWAVHDVSFEVARGEALGIIGANGAGKSTVLKLLTRILKPTSGRAAIVGRTGALIEVAAGFHPDLTGRENVYMQGAIMGMKRAEITDRLDDIIDFAGVGAFIDTPTKRYSSGMNARLGFSVAAHLNPEVLIIDEVLAVGDSEFQQRCMMRMRDFRQNGAAIVFVSHNMNAVVDLCSKALLLSAGQVSAAGTPQDVVAAYLTKPHGEQRRPGKWKLRMLDATIGARARGARPGGPFPSGTQCVLDATFAAAERVKDVVFTFMVRQAQTGTTMYAADSRLIGAEAVTVEAGATISISIDFQCNLLRGSYYIDLHAYHPPTQTYYDWRSPAAIFEVQESESHSGVAALSPVFHVCVTSGAGASLTVAS